MCTVLVFKAKHWMSLDIFFELKVFFSQII